jgi:hypothetical protein
MDVLVQSRNRIKPIFSSVVGNENVSAYFLEEEIKVFACVL